jgi:glycosyltransferase involved in cell wall biosynthesis
MGLVIGVDASRNRSGGAKAHLLGMLMTGDPFAYGISRVHVWAYRELLDEVPDAPWLIKHTPPELERSLLRQVWWQYRSLPREARSSGCDILFNTDAGTVCGFRPSVVMSQDMLSYEPGEIQRYGFSLGRLRLIVLRFLQTRSMRHADGVVFLTEYAARMIQEQIGKLSHPSVIPLGVGVEFRQSAAAPHWYPSRPVRCLYVSNALPYKHQWKVVRAIGDLRESGHEITLLLAGGGTGRAQQLLNQEIARTDPKGEFVRQIGFVRHREVPALLAGADIFIFASSCENMPVTLVEAMAAALPIACSNRGPMPEILQDGGVYFDPEDASSIAAAVEKIVVDESVRISIARRALELAEQFSWGRCANETWAFLRLTLGSVGRPLTTSENSRD